MALKVTPTYETPQSSFQKSQKGTLNEFRRRVFLFGEIYGISKDTCYVSKMRHESNDVEWNNENTNDDTLYGVQQHRYIRPVYTDSENKRRAFKGKHVRQEVLLNGMEIHK